MKKVNLKILVEAGVMIALAFILNNIKLFKMPRGGSITAGGYVPLLIFALRHGTIPGLITGAVYGVLDYIIDPFMLTPVQVLLDYPLAYSMLGLAGLSQNKGFDNFIDGTKTIAAILFANFMRMFMAVLSGVVFFGSSLPKNLNPWWASFLYNFSYIAPNTIIAIILIVILLPRLERMGK